VFKKSRDGIKLHQEKYNVNSVISHNVLASDYLTDCILACVLKKQKKAKYPREMSCSSDDEPLVGLKAGIKIYCSQCGLQVDRSEEGNHCPRCYSQIHIVLEEDLGFDPFKNVTSLHKIRSPENLSEVYDVKFQAGDSGMTLDDDWLGKSIVVDDVPAPSYVVEGEEVLLGDILVSINGESCVGLCLERVESILQSMQENIYRIRFRRPTSKREAFDQYDGDAIEALGAIYKQKSISYEPPDHMDMIYGYIRRFRGEKMITFQFFRESDNQFMLAAVLSRTGKGRIVFYNTQDVYTNGEVKDIGIHSESARYLGFMESNFLGNEFTLHDYRENIGRKKFHELALVDYEINVLGRVPNSLKAALPRWDAEQGMKGQSRSLSDRYRQSNKTRFSADLNIIQKLSVKKGDEYQAVELEEEEDLLIFDTKKPSWSEELQAWTLNFNGRVKMASKKNFLLVPEAKNESMDEEFGAETVCLRFGKVEKDRFSLDFRHPISPIQAMAICLSSFSTKLVVT